MGQIIETIVIHFKKRSMVERGNQDCECGSNERSYLVRGSEKTSHGK